VDATGAAYITGFTDSTQATFPVAVGPDLTYNGGSSDAFVAKVSAVVINPPPPHCCLLCCLLCNTKGHDKDHDKCHNT
jgi:hypothetical protein